MFHLFNKAIRFYTYMSDIAGQTAAPNWLKISRELMGTLEVTNRRNKIWFFYILQQLIF